jgi:Mlc titration factor MtfA (ptsG expression regulator)
VSGLLVVLVAAALATALWLALAPRMRRRRRLALARRNLCAEQRQRLTAGAPIYARIPADLRDRLDALIQVFVREKTFVGCNDLTVTDEMRYVIAAYACLLVVNRPGVPASHFYDELLSVLVYPTAFVAPQSHHDETGLVTEGEDVLAGQAWDARRIILSWQDVLDSAQGAQNVVLHEFAHYLDMEDETMDGAPGLGSARAYQEWSDAFWDEYERLCDQVDAGAETFLDPYAATEPAEFFAVATETFFMQPKEFLAEHPALYEQLRKYYRLEPATWTCGDSE